MNIIIISILISSIQHQYRTAPVQNSECLFQGCKCSKNSDESFDILCISSDSEIQFPLRSNSSFNTNSTINTLLIKRFKFRRIPDGAFADLEVRNLIIGENQLETLTYNAFRDMKSLTLLRIIEKNFNRIEPGALDWVKNSLSELGLWQLDFKHKDIDLFFTELASLNRLRTLNLMGYYLTEFKANWTRIFGNLTTLSLASNDMRRLSPAIFNNAKHLQSLDLSNNFLNNLTNIFDALKSIK
jgi:Leucine-rich repeat (LRR) protein